MGSSIAIGSFTKFYSEDVKSKDGKIINPKSGVNVKDQIINQIGSVCSGKTIDTLGDDAKKKIQIAINNDLATQTSRYFYVKDSASKIYACTLLYLKFNKDGKTHETLNLDDLDKVRKFVSHEFNISMHNGDFAYGRDLSKKYFSKILTFLNNYKMNESENKYSKNQNLMATQIHDFSFISKQFLEYQNDSYGKIINNNIEKHTREVHELSEKQIILKSNQMINELFFAETKKEFKLYKNYYNFLIQNKTFLDGELENFKNLHLKSTNIKMGIKLEKHIKRQYKDIISLNDGKITWYVYFMIIFIECLVVILCKHRKINHEEYQNILSIISSCENEISVIKSY